MKVLQCDSKGDKRFSAWHAKVSLKGTTRSIEEWYQESKRLTNNLDEGPHAWREVKGKQVVGVDVFGTRLPAEMLTPWYWYLWGVYFIANPGLLEYARQFDTFTDTFRGKSINCQADVVKAYATHKFEDIWCRPAIAQINEIISSQPKSLGNIAIGPVAEGATPILTVVATGHRPTGLGGWKIDNPIIQAISTTGFNVIRKLVTENGARIFIQGGAAGWDLLFARAVIEVRKATGLNDVQLWSMLPYRAQRDRLKYAWLELYDRVITKSQEVITLYPNPMGDDRQQRQEAIKYLFGRNEAMLECLPDRSSFLLSCFNGAPTGLMTLEQLAQYLPPGTKGGTQGALLKAIEMHQKRPAFNPRLYNINPGGGA